jgi:hypothetical protein
VEANFADKFLPLPTLPDEIYTLILMETDHKVLCNFGQVSKWAQAVAGRTWKQFTLRCWSRERLVGIKSNASKQLTYREAFEEAWHLRVEEMQTPKFDCVHCKSKHDTITHEEWMAYMDDPQDWEFKEYAELWCICPECDAGSWHSCDQHLLQFGNNDA